jgi:uncharacterized membrane protein
VSNQDFERLVGPDQRRLPRPDALSATIILIALAVAVGMVALWPRGELLADLDPIGFADDTVDAEVIALDTAPCSYAPQQDCTYAVFEVIAGVHAGTEVEQDFPIEPGQPDLRVGDRVHLSVVDAGFGQIMFQYADLDRSLILVVLGVLFAAAVVALGRLRGVAAIVGLGLSVAILVWFILPAILIGRDAVMVALVGGGAIMLVTLYLAHGYNPLTHAAALGAFGALLLTVGLSAAAVALARFSGLVGDESFFLATIPDLDLRGLLLAGITLGALGALDDVTVTQASAVWEVHGANPALGKDDLFRSGLRVGRDHIVSTVNTLLLAYAGAALPLLILFVLSGSSFGVVASSEVVAVEIVRTLVGSIGLVSAVPLTTWLASRLATRSA